MPDLEKIASRLGNCPIVYGPKEKQDKESLIIFQQKPYTILQKNHPMPEYVYKSIGNTTVLWPDAMEHLRKHKWQIYVISRPNKKTLVDQLIEHMVVTTQVVAEMPVCGIIWGSSALTNLEQFQYYATRMVQFEKLPIPVWIQIQFSRDENGGVVVSTNGMQDYGLMEVECNVSPLPIDSTLNIVEQFLAYIINYGPIVQDGNTISLEDEIYDKAFTVHIRESFRPDVGLVYLLDFDGHEL